jgi:hypothetical protein
VICCHLSAFSWNTTDRPGPSATRGCSEFQHPCQTTARTPTLSHPFQSATGSRNPLRRVVPERRNTLPGGSHPNVGRQIPCHPRDTPRTLCRKARQNHPASRKPQCPGGAAVEPTGRRSQSARAGSDQARAPTNSTLNQ